MITAYEVSKNPGAVQSIQKQQGDQGILDQLDQIVGPMERRTAIDTAVAQQLDQWLTAAMGYVTDAQDERFERLRSGVQRPSKMEQARAVIADRLPTFVYYANYYRIRPRIHLKQLHQRVQAGDYDEEYDFGNLRLLDLLGLDAGDLAAMGDVSDPDAQDVEGQTHVQDQLDERMYRLNAAGVDLTQLVRNVWGDEDATLDFRIDGDYLKVVSRDDLGVEVELDQKSDGFRWLVSFYVVFRSQASGDLSNSILLLDEPGLSLHALKQQEFRRTVSQLAEDNQTIYTTHSPFMVGTDELDLVRIVDMKDREAGTRVHTKLIADDPRSLFPLQTALGYALSQSLFAQPKNLVLEGITDYFYVESMAEAFREASLTTLAPQIALVPAGDAGKVVYLSVLLQAQELKVAALLDSDQAGDHAPDRLWLSATQDHFVEMLGSRRIHRTKDYYRGEVTRPEIEDLLRDTLVRVARDELGWNVESTSNAQPQRPIADVFESEISDFSKSRLAKRFMRWLAAHEVADLTEPEREGWTSLFDAVNKSLR